MHRIDTPTAQKDKFGAGKNGFTRGNPQTGTPATDLDDDYFDMLQEELAGVVEASGVNLEKSKHNQLLTALKALLLSRAHPFADIKADGAAAIAEALSNFGLGKTDSPEFGGLTAPNITMRPGKISLSSSVDGTAIAITVNGVPVTEIRAENIYHKRALAAGEFLQAPKLIFRDGDVNLVGSENNLVIQVGGSDIASLTPGNNFFKGNVTAETSLQVGSTCILDTDGNLTGSKWGGWLDAFMKDAMSTDGNGLWWDAFSSQLQFRIGDFNIADATGGAGTSVTFLKAFKNGCLMVIPVPGSGGAAEQIGTQSYSASGAVIQKGASDNSPRSGKYLAIGY